MKISRHLDHIQCGCVPGERWFCFGIALFLALQWPGICTAVLGQQWQEEAHANPWRGYEAAILVNGSTLWVLGAATAGESAPVWRSNDGVNWTRLGKTGPWRQAPHDACLAFQSRLWVLTDGKVWSSLDGVTWIAVLDPAPWGNRTSHHCLVHNGKMWVIGGYLSLQPRNDVWSSDDGIVWTEVTSSAPWCARLGEQYAAFGGKIWILAGGCAGQPMKDAWYSTNGSDWTQATASAPWPDTGFQTATGFAGKIWLLGHDQYQGNNYVWTSPDGVLWSQVLEDGPWSWVRAHCVAFGTRLCVKDQYEIWFSDDGVTWARTAPVAPWSGRRTFGTSTFLTEAWVLGGSASGPAPQDAWSSTDGVTWLKRSSAIKAENALVFDGKLWAFNPSSPSGIFWSSDGQTWTQVVNPHGVWYASYASAAVFDGKMWLIGGVVGPNAEDPWWVEGAFSSADGQTWQLYPAPWGAREGHVSLVFNNKLWVMAGSGLRDVWSTSDGQTWEQVTPAAPWPRRSFCAGAVIDGKMWLLGGKGAGGTLLNDVWSSSDGVNWTQVTSAAPWWPRQGHRALVYQNKLWVLGGVADDYAYLNDVWYSEVAPPVPFAFTETPNGGWLEEDQSLSMRVAVTGTIGAVTYQWVKDGVNIPGATTNAFAVPAVKPADEGWYWCIVTDEAKSVHESPHTQVLVFPQGSLPAATILGILLTAGLSLCIGAVLTLTKRRRTFCRK